MSGEIENKHRIPSDLPAAWRETLAKVGRLDAALNAIEAAEPVESWQIDGLHIWPLLRQIAGSGAQQTIFMDWDALSPILAALRRAARTADTAEETDSNAALEVFSRAANGAVWFFGNTAGYTKLGGRQIHAHFDTLRAGLEARGQPTHAFLLHESADDSEAHASRWFKDCSSIEAFLRAAHQSTDRHWRQAGEKLGPMLARMRADTGLKEFISQELLLHPEVVRLVVARSLTVRDWFLQAFEAHKPKAVVYYPGFTPLSYGISAAARLSGVRSIELQHGINGWMHQGYSWSRTPDGGWNSTSQGMLTWTNSDSAQFRATGNRTPILCGPGSLRLARHLLLEQPAAAAQAETHEQLRQALLDQVDAVHRIASTRGRKPVLFAPQYQLNKDALAGAVEELAGRGGIELLRREHPVTKLRHTAKSAGAGQDAVSKQVTAAVLPAVLASCCGIVTEFSSLFLEAALLGLPTVSIMAGGPTYFSSYLEEFGNAMVSYAADPAGLTAAFERLGPPPDDPVKHLEERLSGLAQTGEIIDAMLS